MTFGFGEEKVEGGKLLRIKTEFYHTIVRAEITGDFFLHPEEGLELIEKALIKIELGTPEEEIAEKVRKVVEWNKIDLVGITPQAIARVALKSIGGYHGE